MFDWFHKTAPKNTYVLLLKIFSSWKKHVISTLVRLSLLFQEKTWLIKSGFAGQEWRL